MFKHISAYLLAVALALSVWLAPTSPAIPADILAALNGTWIGDGHRVIINMQTMQANIDRRRPFQYDPIVIKNIAHPMVVLQIGKTIVIGLIDKERLTLTGLSGNQNQITLTRKSR